MAFLACFQDARSFCEISDDQPADQAMGVDDEVGRSRCVLDVSGTTAKRKWHERQGADALWVNKKNLIFLMRAGDWTDIKVINAARKFVARGVCEFNDDSYDSTLTPALSLVGRGVR